MAQDEEKGIGQQAAEFVMNFALIAMAASLISGAISAVGDMFSGGQEISGADLGELSPSNTPDTGQDRGAGLGV